MKTTLHASVLATALSCAASAQTARFVGESLVIADGPRRIRLPPVIKPHPIARCVHAVQKRSGEYFILIGGSEWSRGYPPRGGLCGSGVEEYIEWLHVRNGKIIETQKGLYLSCWDGRSGVPPAWQDGQLRWGVVYVWIDEGAGHAEQISWTYDPRAPRKGIQEQKKTIPKQ